MILPCTLYSGITFFHKPAQPVLFLDFKVLSLAPNPAFLLPFGLGIHREVLSPEVGSPWIAVSALFLVLIAGHACS